MTFIIPEPDIKLYHDGFDEHDLLNRKAEGERLSKIVEAVSEPLTIAIDGAWGSGKSVFLKCWVGEHSKNENHAAQPIYFDAFAHDFMNDPLIALVSVIDERIAGDESLWAKGWKTAKTVAPKLARFAIRVGLSAATVGGTEIANAVGDAAIEKSAEMLDGETQKFWAAENSKRAAIKEFRDALTEMAKEQKLVIVVDELDRCRPDFALSLLEIIKHLFDVPNVGFAFGTNMDALAHMVTARDGSGIDGRQYLNKFFAIRIEWELKQHSLEPDTKRYFEKRAQEIANKTQLQTIFFDIGFEFVKRVSPSGLLQLRDINKLITEILLFCEVYDRRGYHEDIDIYAVLVLLTLRSKNKELFEFAQLGKHCAPQIIEFLGITDRSHERYYGDWRPNNLWLAIQYFFGDPLKSFEEEENSPDKYYHNFLNSRTDIMHVQVDHVGDVRALLDQLYTFPTIQSDT